MDAARDAAAPERHAHALRARRHRVPGDHAQVVREGRDLSGRPAPVVDRRSLREDQRGALVERGNPVGGGVVPAHARRSARAERAERRGRVRRPRADERVHVGGACLAREHDRVVRRLVAVAAALDEVHADQLRARDRGAAVVALRLAAGQCRRSGERGEHQHERPAHDQSDSLHVTLPRRYPPKSDRKGFAFPQRCVSEP